MRGRFLALDGLRGVCALSILLYHCMGMFHKGSFFQHGYLAVDVFFILSGFVISLTYEDRLRDGGSRAFLWARARRLLPTYWLGAGFSVAVFLWMAHAGYVAAGYAPWMIWIFVPVTTFLLIPDYITPDGVLYPAMDSVAWSLFVEWFAYFAYAAGAHRWKTWGIIVLAATGWAVMTIAGYHTGSGWCAGAHRPTLFNCGLLRCASGFLAGMAIYRVHRNAWFLKLPAIATELLLGLWLFIAVIPTPHATPTLDAFLVIVCAPLLVCLLIRSDARAPAYCKQLGELSYPLYVSHSGIILLAIFTPVFGFWRGPNPVNGIAVVALSLALAWVIARIVATKRKDAAQVAFADRDVGVSSMAS
ncbi:MAG TPA: acyltransferase [Rhizomicrobium sp.]|jgi:peptidoglycan/LPS O-acetylase OafA/YrhL